MQISKRFLLIFGFGILVSAEVFASEGWEFPTVQTVSNSTSPPCCVGNTTDDFGDGNIAPSWMDISTCGTASESGGQLILDKIPGCPGTSFVIVISNYQVCGDFDVQIDFDLASWPSPTIARFAVLGVRDAVTGVGLNIERFRNAFTEPCTPFLDSYKSWSDNSSNCVSTFVSTSDMQGKFRITRAGTTFTSYYWNGSSWVTVRSNTGSAGPSIIWLYSGSDDAGSHQVRMDNLIIQSQAPINSDGDTIPDCRDNCPLVSNSNQSDIDSDTVGDSCDVCPTTYNPLQEVIKPGDANASNNYTLGDAISIVNYIFNKPGYPACPSNTNLCWLSDLLCRGDWDASGTVTLSDAIRSVNLIFNKPGGPWTPVPIGACCVPPT